jgi:2,3-bisphosphoglycerate-independent phosphoglycerate mutase
MSRPPGRHFVNPFSRHLNIGAGRVVWQDIVRIDMAIKKKQFHKNPVIVEACERAKKGTGRLHFLGLVSASTRISRFFPMMSSLI